MADRVLRKLKRRELLQMLLVQCEETERLQQELDNTKEELEELQNGYERLKKKLDVKDERLNQKDAKIAELKHMMEEMHASRVIELNEAGSIAKAAFRLNGVFEAAQQAAEQYLMNVKRLGGSELDYIETERRTLSEKQEQQGDRLTGQRPAEYQTGLSEPGPAGQGLTKLPEQRMPVQPETSRLLTAPKERPSAGTVSISDRRAARGQKISHESDWNPAVQRWKLHG